MAKEYPIRVDLEGERVVVVGGGAVAERRVERLVDAGADVRVVAPEVTDRLEAQTQSGRIDWEDRPYREGDLRGARLVFAATDDPSVQSNVVAEATRREIPVDAVGRDAEGDVSVPAVAELGPIRLSVDTGGGSPALAGALRRHLESELDPGWARGADLLAEMRPVAVDAFAPDERRELFRALVDELPDALSGEATGAAADAESVRDEARIREWIERAAGRAGIGEAVEPILAAVGVESE